MDYKKTVSNDAQARYQKALQYLTGMKTEE